MQDNKWKEQLDDFTSQARILHTKVETLNRKIDEIRYKDTAGVAEKEIEALTEQITNYQKRIEKVKQAIINVEKIREEREAESVIIVKDNSLEREQYNLKAQEIEESITFTTALDQALFKQALKKLNDNKKEIRCLGVTGMEQICHKYREAVSILIPFLQDPEGDVRAHVLNSLIKLEVKESLSKFVEALDDENVRVRLAGVRGIHKLAGSSAAQYLIYALRDKNEEVRERAAMYLGRCCSKNAIPELFALFYKEQDSSMRKVLLQTISAIRDESAIPYLIRILNDASFECRKLSALILNEWTCKTFNFNPNASIVDRERSIIKYEQWWNRNRERFKIIGGALSIRQKRIMEQVKAEQEMLRAEQEVKAKAEQERLRVEQEASAKAEWKRMRAEKEAKANAERERQRAEQEAKEKAERERRRAEQEAKEKAERERRRAKKEAKAERERIKAEKEARAKAEQKRIKTEKEKMKKSEKKKKRLKPDSKVKTVRKKKIQKRNKKETSKKTQKRKPKSTRRLDTDALL